MRASVHQAHGRFTQVGRANAVLICVSLQLEGPYGGTHCPQEAGDCGQVDLSASVSLQKRNHASLFMVSIQASCFNSRDIISL